ncbi:MAG: hypothetical protein SXA11_16905 [Cyanobacteriota bacterium]|nr:hypothetical protein [Cyanobacteriota bacterium]
MIYLLILIGKVKAPLQVVKKAIATMTCMAVLSTYEIAAVSAYLTRPNLAFLPVSIAATESPPVASELKEILPKIKQETKVPVLLPGQLLITATDNKIYIDGSGNAEGYKIELAFEENCSEPRCLVGYLSGEKAGKAKEDEFSRELSLTNNIKGYFRPKECDRLCTIPIIGWEHKGVFYRIALKGVGQSPEIEGETLMKMANSAIEAGAR